MLLQLAAQEQEEKIAAMQQEKEERLSRFQKDVRKRVQKITRTQRKQQLEKEYEKVHILDPISWLLFLLVMTAAERAIKLAKFALDICCYFS